MTQDIYASMGISREVYGYGEKTLEALAPRFEEIDRVAEYNQLKVLKAMQDCRVSEACLLGTTGYGYNDIGRDTPTYSIRNPRWCALRLPAGRTRWHWRS